ncbi:hypothetical protein M513_12222 [Trichuris suis]|uniref:Uncharacterized protein n=1 Tax=Trichuris suis TaxID=68888 RepID=A0A085LPK4_9BILA|nr:hypothetical protein M513_12222 [Trichuris suis]
MAANFILISLVALTCLLQPTSQQVLNWDDGERRRFGQTAKSFIAEALSPRIYLHMGKTFAVKCSGRRDAPYGITLRTFDLVNCGCNAYMCSGNCHAKHESIFTECQFAARLNKTATREENFLGLLCYERRGNILPADITEELICATWRYPTSSVPQFRIPAYLKSPFAQPLVYFPPQIEQRVGGPLSHQNDWPKNEHERTGFGGIGAFEKYGPNRILYIIVSSQGEDRFEFIPEDGNAGEPYVRSSAKDLRDDMGGTCTDEELLSIVDAKRVLHAGYLKDRLNTDNAWMEGFIVHLNDPEGKCFRPPYEPSVSKSGRYTWLELPMNGSGIDDYLSPLVSPLVVDYK